MSTKIRDKNIKTEDWIETKLKELKKDETYIIILSSVEALLNISFDEFNNSSRKRQYFMPRHYIYYFLKKYTENYSLDVIGALFNQDHASVKHGEKNITNLKQSDKDVKRVVGYITATLEEHLNKLSERKNDVFINLLETLDMKSEDKILWMKRFMKAK